MPDADKGAAVKALLGAGFGAAGQRCMAISVAVLVGEQGDVINSLVEGAKQLRVGWGAKVELAGGGLSGRGEQLWCLWVWCEFNTLYSGCIKPESNLHKPHPQLGK